MYVYQGSLPASQLMQDDRFIIGSDHVRIESINHTPDGQIRVDYRDVTTLQQGSLEVDNDRRFNIFNLKED